MRKKLPFLLLALLLLSALLLSPRFGWGLYNTDATKINYSRTYFSDGNINDIYSNGQSDIIISYPHRFSGQLNISIDGNAPTLLSVGIDGRTNEEGGALPFLGSSIVWGDSSGIFFRVYLLAILSAVVSLFFYFKSTKCQESLRIFFIVTSALSLLASFLIALRIIF